MEQNLSLSSVNIKPTAFALSSQETDSFRVISNEDKL